MFKAINIIRKSGKRSIPNIFTFFNAFFGFLSIVKSLENDYTLAVYYILLSALMDFFDGRAARALGVSTNLGMELDSLSDVISFCLAPAILLYSVLLYNFGQMGILTAGIYIISGIFRLAKFNITIDQQRNYFLGLPSTAAALFIVSLALYKKEILDSSLYFLISNKNIIILILIISFLMISHLRFPSFKKVNFYNIIYFLFWMLSSILFCVINKYPLMFILLLGYIIIGILYTIIISAKHYLILKH